MWPQARADGGDEVEAQRKIHCNSGAHGSSLAAVKITVRGTHLTEEREAVRNGPAGWGGKNSFVGVSQYVRVD